MAANTKVLEPGIRGWLKYFCFVLIFANPLLSILNALRTLPLFENGSGTPQELAIGKVVYLSICATLSGLSIYAGLSLWTRKTYAIRLAKIYLILFMVLAFVSSVIIDLAGGDIAAPEANFIIAWFHAGMWYIILRKSKRVQITFPGD